ncbi:hypothetical protein RUM44_002183 [Polyplax serrata]|uniref:Complexin n=1 Tax=Polyplax serrata TaxID=468196 RepID=A0ABR1AMU1_POLSC
MKIYDGLIIRVTHECDLISGAVGGDDDDGDTKEKEEEAERERQEAIREAEERRKEKHRKMEEEREKMRQEIRDKVITNISSQVLSIVWPGSSSGRIIFICEDVVG